jgi:hypothetical protein
MGLFDFFSSKPNNKPANSPNSASPPVHANTSLAMQASQPAQAGGRRRHKNKNKSKKNKNKKNKTRRNKH